MSVASTTSASFAAGAVTVGTGASRGGFIGTVAGTIQNSFWDTTATGIADDSDANMPEGKSPSELKSQTGCTGIFVGWNVSVDGTSGNDDPWDFGTSGEYPALKYGGMDPIIQLGDYDLNDDGLIDVRNLAQLDAVRYDLNGDATGAAFPFPFRDRSSGGLMGCPSGTCAGCELAADLDFDTNGDGATYTGSGVSAAGDSGDEHYNGGGGWGPIRTDTSTTRFAATFKGNGFIISNLFIKRATADDAGLFGAIDGGARVKSLGVSDAYVNGDDYVGILAGANYVVISSSWSDGAVLAKRFGGGLVGCVISAGASHEGAITVGCSRALARAVPAGGSNAYAGGLAGEASGAAASAEITAGYSTGTATSTVSGYIGGLTGYIADSNVTITDSYWDTTTSGITSGGNGAGKTTRTETARPTPEPARRDRRRRRQRMDAAGQHSHTVHRHV